MLLPHHKEEGMRRPAHRFVSAAQALGLAGALGLGFVGGVACEGSGDENDETNVAALKACGLDDGSVEHNAKVRACDPSETHKTTICHIPPGNPANAHTLCIGNPAVPAHLDNHGDHLGACENERPCTPPPPPPTTGTGGTTGAAGTTGTGGAGGSPAPTGGTGGAEVPPPIDIG
jgi:hypothetical protein